MRCSLNLHLRSAHEKPQQPNRFDSLIDPGKMGLLNVSSIEGNFLFHSTLSVKDLHVGMIKYFGEPSPQKWTVTC